MNGIRRNEWYTDKDIADQLDLKLETFHKQWIAKGKISYSNDGNRKQIYGEWYHRAMMREATICPPELELLDESPDSDSSLDGPTQGPGKPRKGKPRQRFDGKQKGRRKS